MPTLVVRALVAITVLWAATLSALPAAHGQTRVTPADRTTLGLTVYSGFAQIRDTRTVAGGGEIVWTGFPSSIDPGTILLTRDGERIASEFLGVTRGAIQPRALYAAHLGQPVVLVAQDGREIAAEIVSEAPIFRTGDRLILDWQGHVEIPAVGTDPIEPGIRWRATGSGGAVTMTYLADGLAWSADYAAILDEGGPIELTGSVTIDNRTDHAYPEARIQLVAGDVRRGGAGPPQPRFAVAEAGVADAEAARVPDREALGDVHLYTLPEPVTIGAEETVRTPLFRDTSVDIDREYVLRGQRFWYQAEHPGFPPRENPEVWLHFRNEGLAGAGEPLPEGILHVYRRDESGALQFVGDGSIPDTPDRERIDVAIGSAFDLVAERVQTDFRQLDPRTHESAWQITIRNRSAEDRTVHVYEPLAGDATIVEESRSHERIDADTVRWTVPVEARGESVLTYRVRTTF